MLLACADGPRRAPRRSQPGGLRLPAHHRADRAAVPLRRRAEGLRLRGVPREPPADRDSETLVDVLSVAASTSPARRSRSACWCRSCGAGGAPPARSGSSRAALCGRGDPDDRAGITVARRRGVGQLGREIVHSCPGAVRARALVFLFALVRARMVQGGAVGRPDRAGREGADAAASCATRSPRPSTTRRSSSSTGSPRGPALRGRPGRRYEPPEDAGRRAISKVERDGDCIAAIVYDASLREAQDHVRAVGRGGGARARERAPRRRAARQGRRAAPVARAHAEIGLEERRRLERDLHDGAQQRLVSMALNMRLARTSCATTRRRPSSCSTAPAGARRGAGGAARAGSRDPPGRPVDRGLNTALETLACARPARRARRAARRAAAGGGRACRLLRGRGGAHQRREVRRRHRGRP